MKNLTHTQMIERFADICGAAFGEGARKQILSNLKWYPDVDESQEEHFVQYRFVGVEKALDDDLNFTGFRAYVFDPEYVPLSSEVSFDNASFVALSLVFVDDIQKKLNIKLPVLSNVIAFPGARKK